MADDSASWNTGSDGISLQSTEPHDVPENDESVLPLSEVGSEVVSFNQSSVSPPKRLKTIGRKCSRMCDSFNTWKSSTPWLSGVYLGCVISGTVLLCNVGLILFGAFKHEGYQNGIGTLIKGSKKSVDNWNVVFHVILNILSTGLLTSSNYCMQILSAPTRGEIDEAHSQGTYLDIGVMSVGNYAHIERKRTLMSVLLAISSIPLHLFYNAAIFKVVTGQDYSVHFINASDASMLSNLYHATTNLTNNAWRAQYDKSYMTDFGDLYLVADSVGFSLNLSHKDSNGQGACLYLELDTEHVWARADLGKITHDYFGEKIPISYPLS